MKDSLYGNIIFMWTISIFQVKSKDSGRGNCLEMFKKRRSIIWEDFEYFSMPVEQCGKTISNGTVMEFCDKEQVFEYAIPCEFTPETNMK